jgi:3-isopropylmalate/(R)-2-methylmalate dehydratase small subunit
MKFPVPFTAKAVALPLDDVDTDQIIPARFLKTTVREGLGAHLFHDRAADPGFPLKRPEAAGARILVAGRNFGCGSSREHAAWALADRGFRAVLAVSFGEIFRGNALKNGLLPIALPEAVVAPLHRTGACELTIDLAAQEVRLPGGAVERFIVDPFAKSRLLAGTDELGWLLAFADSIAAYELAHDHPANLSKIGG